MFVKDLWPDSIANKELCEITDREPVLNRLRRSEDIVAKQALQWTSQGHRSRGRPKNTLKRDLDKEIWTTGFKYSWRKMEVTAQDIVG